MQNVGMQTDLKLLSQCFVYFLLRCVGSWLMQTENDAKLCGETDAGLE